MMVSKLPLCKIALYFFSIFLVGCGSSSSDVTSLTEKQLSESSINTDTDESLKSAENSSSIVAETRDINITWSDNSDNESEFIIERRIASNVDYGTTYYLTENVTSYNDVDVETGETYCYRISASNTAGQSSSSETCIEL